MRLAQSPLCTRQRPNSGHCGRSELCQKQTSGLLIGVYFDTLIAARQRPLLFHAAIHPRFEFGNPVGGPRLIRRHRFG